MKCGAFDNGSTLYVGLQDSNLVSHQGCSTKRPRIMESNIKEFEDEVEQDELEDQLVTLSEAASGFLETAFKSKLDNSARGKKLRNLGY